MPNLHLAHRYFYFPIKSISFHKFFPHKSANSHTNPHLHPLSLHKKHSHPRRSEGILPSYHPPTPPSYPPPTLLTDLNAPKDLKLPNLLTTNKIIPNSSLLIPNYSYWFSRYLRRPLTPVESAIITRLERQRSHGGRIRIIIDDPHADTDPTIRDLLTLYLQWLNRRLYPDLTAAISAPHLPEARRAARTISPDTLYTSGRSADSLRGHTFHHLLHLPNKSASTTRSERKPGRGHLALVHQQTKPTYRTPEQIRDLRTLVGGPTYYLEPPHKKPHKPRPATLRKLLPFHNRPWDIDPKQRPPHATNIEHLPSKAHSIGARANRGEGILPSYKNHPTNPTHAPKIPTALNLLKVLPLLPTHQKEGKIPTLRPPPSPTQNRRHPQTFLIPHS